MWDILGRPESLKPSRYSKRPKQSITWIIYGSQRSLRQCCWTWSSTRFCEIVPSTSLNSRFTILRNMTSRGVQVQVNDQWDNIKIYNLPSFPKWESGAQHPWALTTCCINAYDLTKAGRGVAKKTSTRLTLKTTTQKRLNSGFISLFSSRTTWTPHGL